MDQALKMHRKTVYLPLHIVAKVKRIAHIKKVSFAEVIRQALEAYCDNSISPDDEAILDRLVDVAIESTKASIARIEALEKKLDKP